MSTDNFKSLRAERLRAYLNPSAMAYRDLCRTIRKKKGITVLDNDSTLSGVAKKVIGKIDSALNCLDQIGKIKELDEAQKEFDKWHQQLCDEIKCTYNTYTKYSESYEDFEDGQAQKWINMTLKNMYILSGDKDSINDVYKYLHCPVDNLIIAAAKDINKFNKKSSSYDLIQIPKKGWSQWKYEEYNKFQDELRDKLKETVYLMDFEFDIWTIYKEHPKSKDAIEEKKSALEGKIKSYNPLI